MERRTPATVTEELALQTMLAQAEDSASLEAVRSLLAELRRTLGKEADPAALRALTTADAAAIRLVDGKDKDPAAALDRLTGLVNDVQSLLMNATRRSSPPPAEKPRTPRTTAAVSPPRKASIRPAVPAPEPQREAHSDEQEPSAPAHEHAETGASPIHVTRTADTVSLIGDFLQEANDGLDEVERLLMTVQQDAIDRESVNGLFRVFHTIKGVAGFLELQELASLAHATETLLDEVRGENLALEGAVMDLVFDASDLVRKMLVAVRQATAAGTVFGRAPELKPLVQRLEGAVAGEEAEEEPIPAVRAGDKLGDVLRKTGEFDPAEIDRALETQKETGRRLGEELVAGHAARPKEVVQALRAQQRAEQGVESPQLRESIRVDLERVDQLVAMIGELVIVEAIVTNTPQINTADSGALRNSVGQLDRITRELQHIGMRLRMIPVRGLFQKMARVVRDLSRKEAKDVRLVQSGQGTELDRSVVEQLADPLMHMIRNAVDHGIEAAEERRNRGKPAVGTIALSAHHEGGNIVIEISDDGQGLDREAILAKAVAKGLIAADAEPADADVHALLFTPGFSTASEVTELSGRGVGMDVVRRNLESMRGRITIQSVEGEGCVFRIVLPMTLAIIDGTMVACGEERYIVPTLNILESFRPTEATLVSWAGEAQMIRLRGEVFPMQRLDQLLGIRSERPESTAGLVVVVESMGRKVGLLVDEVIAQQQVVIKGIGAALASARYLSGAAILADGRVGLILNVDELASLAPEAPRGTQRSRA